MYKVKKHFINFESFGKEYRIEKITPEEAASLPKEIPTTCAIWTLTNENFSYYILENFSRYNEEFELEKIPSKFDANSPYPIGMDGNICQYIPFGKMDLTFEEKAAVDMAVDILKEIQTKKVIEEKIEKAKHNHF